MLIGNVGKVMGDVAAFPDARPDDGLLDVGVVTAKGPWRWSRALARAIAGKAERSPFVEVTRGRKFDIRLSKKLPYQLDGGEREPSARLRVKIRPGAVTVCVPSGAP